MALTITMKRNDTRPIQNITLLAPDPGDPTSLIAVDLTTASSAKLNADSTQSADTFTSSLTFASDRTTGIVIWTPIATDTDLAELYNAEVQVTWSDGGIETYPNDSNFSIHIVADLG